MNFISLHANYFKNVEYPLIYETKFKSLTDKETSFKSFKFEFEKFENLRLKKKDVLTNKGTIEQKKENTILIFDCALPYDETKAILNDKDGYLKLENGFKSLMLNIQKEYKFTPIFYAFDGENGFKCIDNKEYTKHFHASLCFYNYDFETKRSILRTLNRFVWSKFQDLAEATFQSCGLNYRRGIKKQSIIKDKELYVHECIDRIIDSSIDVNNIIDIELLKQNIKDELFKALRYEFQEKTKREKLLKYDVIDTQLKRLQTITYELINEEK